MIGGFSDFLLERGFFLVAQCFAEFGTELHCAFPMWATVELFLFLRVSRSLARSFSAVYNLSLCGSVFFLCGTLWNFIHSRRLVS